MYKLLSFDVYGTLVNTPPVNAKVFRAILDAANSPHVDAQTFYQFWEQRNIQNYLKPYESYKEICRSSLQEAFEHYAAIREGRELELEPARRFKDYILWLQKQDSAEAERFWRENLKGVTAPTPLVVDRMQGRELSAEIKLTEPGSVTLDRCESGFH